MHNNRPKWLYMPFNEVVQAVIKTRGLKFIISPSKNFFLGPGGGAVAPPAPLATPMLHEKQLSFIDEQITNRIGIRLYSVKRAKNTSLKNDK
jgi:hypothetical protein